MVALTTRRRKRLPSSAFALPRKRKFPIDTKNRARNALSRVSQFGTPKEKRIVRRKVRARFPSIQVSR